MAVQRVWFPHAPDGTISASDRARQGIGYGGIVIAVVIALDLFNPQLKSLKQRYQVVSEKQKYKLKSLKKKGQIKWLQ